MSPRRPAVLRDSGSARTLREHLIATAATLIGERGGGALTVREVARAAGVADGALYNHFADRDELFAEALRAYVESIAGQSVDLPRPGQQTVQENLLVHMRFALGVLGRILPAFLGFVRHPAVVSRVYDQLSRVHDGPAPLPHLFAEYLAAEQALGRVSATADVQAGARVLVGVCHDLTLPRLLIDPTAAPREVPDDELRALVAVVLNGLAP
jgi:AcrR family transcriptional regulator